VTVSVIVPTFRRPDDLKRCLDSLKAQTCKADEVLVVVRDTDTGTHAALDGYPSDPLSIRRIGVDVPGQVAALNAALDATKGDVVAITDDDGAPRPEWIARTTRWLEGEPRVGGVGGPDWTHSGEDVVDGSTGVCGTLQWWGRIDVTASLRRIPCDVDVLKGCNMTFRRTAIGEIRFDTHLAGSGAQLFNDFGFCLAIRRAGWRLIYDPAIEIDHYPGTRIDDDKRDRFAYEALADAIHNRTFILKHLPPPNRIAYLTYALLAGSRSVPGLILLPERIVRRAPNAVSYWKATAEGHVRGIKTFLTTATADDPVLPGRRRAQLGGT
jgi:glycosyltransferase involved in cell wall biosynthesis